MVLNAGSAVGLSLGIANVRGVALDESLLAGVLHLSLSAAKVDLIRGKGNIQVGECQKGREATHVVHGADVVLETGSTAVLAGAVGVESGLEVSANRRSSIGQYKVC